MMSLIAALLLGGPAPDPQPVRGIAKLAIALGSVEGKAAGDADYAPLKPGTELAEGSWIRTAPGVRALIELPNAVELRINEKTEIGIDADRKLTLKEGRLYVRIPQGPKQFEIVTELHQIRSDACVLDLDYVPRVPNGDPAITSIRVLEGNVKAFSKKWQPVINGGWASVAYGAQLNTPDPISNASLDTAWVHPLLLARGKADEETSSRSAELITVLAKITPNDPAEKALLALGEFTGPEIARFMARSVLPTLVQRRAAATRVLAETATLKSAGLLTPLLQHAEAEVRITAAHGLARLAGGKDLGFNDAFWKGDALAAGQKAWEDWVKSNSK